MRICFQNPISFSTSSDDIWSHFVLFVSSFFLSFFAESVVCKGEAKVSDQSLWSLLRCQTAKRLQCILGEKSPLQPPHLLRT